MLQHFAPKFKFKGKRGRWSVSGCLPLFYYSQCQADSQNQEQNNNIMSSNKRQKHDHSHNDGLTQIRQEMSRVLNECSELKAKIATKSNYLAVLLKNQH